MPLTGDPSKDIPELVHHGKRKRSLKQIIAIALAERRRRGRVKKEASAFGVIIKSHLWEESKHPRDESGKFSPADHPFTHWYDQTGRTAKEKPQATHDSEAEALRAVLSKMSPDNLKALAAHNGHFHNPRDSAKKIIDALLERAHDRRGASIRRTLIGRPTPPLEGKSISDLVPKSLSWEESATGQHLAHGHDEPVANNVSESPTELTIAHGNSQHAMTRAEVENESRDRKRKWTEVERGPLGRLKWIGSKPNGVGMSPATDLGKWREFATEIGKHGVSEIVSTLEPTVHHRIPAEDGGETKAAIRYRARQSVDEIRGGRGHEAEVPDSHYARQLVHEYLRQGNGIDDLHTLHLILTDIMNKYLWTPKAFGGLLIKHRRWESVTKGAIGTGMHNFTGAAFGRYYINGKQVDEGTYKSMMEQKRQAKQGGAKEEGPAKQEPYQLDEHQRRAADQAQAIHERERHEGVRDSRGAIQTPPLGHGVGMHEDGGLTFLPLHSPASKPKTDIRHNPDLDAFMGEPSQQSKPAPANSRHNPALDEFMAMGNDLKDKPASAGPAVQGKPSAQGKAAAQGKQPPSLPSKNGSGTHNLSGEALNAVHHIAGNFNPKNGIIAGDLASELKHRLGKYPPEVRQEISQAMGLKAGDSDEEITRKFRSAFGNDAEWSKDPDVGKLPGGAGTKSGGAKPPPLPIHKVQSRVREYMKLAGKVPAQTKKHVQAFVKSKYQSLASRYGHKGAAAILTAAVLLMPVPVPGTSLVPVAFAEAMVQLKRMLSKGYEGELDEETIQREAKALVAELMKQNGGEGEGEGEEKRKPFDVSFSTPQSP